MIIITSDLHITDKPLDEYRWGIFQWIKSQLSLAAGKLNTVFILGDLTDAKDKHSSELVNRLVCELKLLSEVAQIYILKGNHDYIEESLPFFDFLSQVGSRIKFITKPHSLSVDDFGILCLPSSRNYIEDWKDFDFDEFDLIFTHQTYEGSQAENGSLLPGIPPAYFKNIQGKVISGDIHVPQKVSSNIQYVGSPYRVRFGDSFAPRVLLIEDGKIKSRMTPFMRRWTLSAKGSEQLSQVYEQIALAPANAGDQVKIRVTMRRSDLGEWAELKKELKQFSEEKGWVLHGIELIVEQSATTVSQKSKITAAKTSKDRVELYGRLKKMDVKLGVELLEAANNV